MVASLPHRREEGRQSFPASSSHRLHSSSFPPPSSSQAWRDCRLLNSASPMNSPIASPSLPPFLPSLDECTAVEVPISPLVSSSEAPSSLNSSPEQQQSAPSRQPDASPPSFGSGDERDSTGRHDSRSHSASSRQQVGSNLLRGRTGGIAAGARGRTGQSCRVTAGRSGRGSSNPRLLLNWVPSLMVFSVVCLMSLLATIIVSVNVLDSYMETRSGLFFHVSDIHLDPLYKDRSSPSDFCRSLSHSEVATSFGQYGCDSPPGLLHTALQQMASVTRHPDFLLVTGDTVAHNLSADDTLLALRQAEEHMSRHFPPSSVLHVYAVGEHEFTPLGSGDIMMTDWLKSIAAVWNDTLSRASNDAMSTFLKGGYYMALIQPQPSHPPTNMAVLVLNTILYSAKDQRPRNAMLVHQRAQAQQQGNKGSSGNSNSSSSNGSNHQSSAEVNGVDDNYADDPAGQFAWLEEQLHQARHWGHQVLLVGHLPPGVDTVKGGALWLPRYEQRFAATVLAYADVIVGQLYGYLHREHFSVMHSHEPSMVVGLGENGGEGLLGESVGGEEWKYVREGPKDIQEDEEEESELMTMQKGGRLQDVVSGISMPVKMLGELSPSHAVASSSSSSSRAGESARRSDGAAWTASRKQKVGVQVSDERHVPSSSLDWLFSLRRGRGRKATGDPSGTASAILISPSLSPVLKNRPAFRAFKYDRSAVLLDYTEHTANLHKQQQQESLFAAGGGAGMWRVQYAARKVFGVESLDSNSLRQLSSSFFNATGYPTDVFDAFCDLRAAGNNIDDDSSAGRMDCCDGCPRFIHCAIEFALYEQFQACKQAEHGRFDSMPLALSS